VRMSFEKLLRALRRGVACPLPRVALIRALSLQVRAGDGEEGGAAEFAAEDV
jgi:hypothetical protein